MEVYHPNDSFHFDNLQLTPPQHITGGSYMTRYSYYNSKQPLYIQTPKTVSKQGIVISGKKAHIDLLLTSVDADTEFVEWIATLEKRSVDLLYEKRHLWFTQELDYTDIENSMASPIRSFRNGNYLLRVNLEPSRHITVHTEPFACKVFDERKCVMATDYIKAEHNIISIIEFQGIKFTSRSFQIELLLRQVLVIPDIPLFETCVIRADNTQPPAPTVPPPVPDIINKPTPATTPTTATTPATTTTTATTTTPTTDDYLGLVKEHQETEINEAVNDESETYITPQPSLKHFECTEIDIDFNNIPDTIDVNEPTFDTAAVATTAPTAAAATTAPAEVKTKQITLKKHKDVLYEMYKVAKHKANEMKRAAMRAYLEAKEIKAKYLLDDLDDLHSDTSDDESHK
jgi:hypothetical protein